MSTHNSQGVTRWGNPSAPKKALLLHGLTSISGSWFQIAEALVSTGYYVVAPDLLGHGDAHRGTDYTIKAFAEDITPLLDEVKPLDLLIGHSLGGVVAAALLPSLDPGSSKSSKLRVVLVDPVLHTSDEGVDQNYNDAVEEIKYPKSAEQYLAQNPKWTQEVARWKVIGVGKCDPEACAMLCNQNRPWSFTHLLPSPSSDLDLIILGADPAIGAVFTPAESIALASSHPNITTAVVSGASHSIHRDFPEVVIDVALTGKVTGGRLHGPTGVGQNNSG